MFLFCLFVCLLVCFLLGFFGSFVLTIKTRFWYLICYRCFEIYICLKKWNGGFIIGGCWSTNYLSDLYLLFLDMTSWSYMHFTALQFDCFLFFFIVLQSSSSQENQYSLILTKTSGPLLKGRGRYGLFGVLVLIVFVFILSLCWNSIIFNWI